jgi:hypothetical protein
MLTVFKKSSFKWSLVAIVTMIAIIWVAMTLPQISSSQADDGTKNQHTTQFEVVHPADYFPLQVGNKWVYLGTGNEYASFSREVVFAEGERVQTLEVNGGADVSKVLQVHADSIKEIYTGVETSTSENILNTETNTQRIILQSPLSIGTAWKNGNNQLEIVDISATILTPAGTFDNCIKVKSTFEQDDSMMFQYYAKGIGMVHQEFIVGNETITSSLESYQLTK